MRKISLSNFTHLNKIKWRIFIPVQKAWYVKKIARGGWSGFGKALTWDPSQMITCHPKKIPKFLLKGGVVQFCRCLYQSWYDSSDNCCPVFKSTHNRVLQSFQFVQILKYINSFQWSKTIQILHAICTKAGTIHLIIVVWCRFGS